MGGVTLSGRIYALVRQKSLNGLHTIEFLKHLIRHLGPQLLVIWVRVIKVIDALPIKVIDGMSSI
jgi:hypothetical protein